MSLRGRPVIFPPGVNLPRTGGPPAFARGMGDYMEPGYRTIMPGSVRNRPPGPVEAGPPLPAEAAAAAGAVDQNLVAAIVTAFMQVITKYGGWPTKEVRLDTFTAQAIIVGTNPILLDEPIRRERRAVTIINSHPLNALWFGPAETVRVNDGGYLAPNGGNINLPINENIRVYGVSNGAGTIVSVVQYA